ncbi:MAG: hypothetical protein ACR2QH_05030 [Geminicoccaceae bacterium]
MGVWPAWIIAALLIGGPFVALFILMIDNSVDNLRRPRKKRWAPVG